MDIVNAVLSLGSIISNWFSILTTSIGKFFSMVGNILSTIGGIIEVTFYGLVSLLSGVWKLIVNVFEGGVFDLVGESFSYLQYYIGTPGIVFMATLLLIILLRIVIAFVFKIFRLRLDYNAPQKHSNGVENVYNITNIKTKSLTKGPLG